MIGVDGADDLRWGIRFEGRAEGGAGGRDISFFLQRPIASGAQRGITRLSDSLQILRMPSPCQKACTNRCLENRVVSGDFVCGAAPPLTSALIAVGSVAAEPLQSYIHHFPFASHETVGRTRATVGLQNGAVARWQTAATTAKTVAYLRPSDPRRRGRSS